MACNHQRLIQDDCAALLFTMRYDDQIALIKRPHHYLEPSAVSRIRDRHTESPDQSYDAVWSTSRDALLLDLDGENSQYAIDRRTCSINPSTWLVAHQFAPSPSNPVSQYRAACRDPLPLMRESISLSQLHLLLSTHKLQTSLS